MTIRARCARLLSPSGGRSLSLGAADTYGIDPEPGQDRPQGEGVEIGRSQLSKVLRKKLPLRRPRHPLKGRQQAEAGDIVLLYAD